jgi:hypothetical protein
VGCAWFTIIICSLGLYSTQTLTLNYAPLFLNLKNCMICGANRGGVTMAFFLNLKEMSIIRECIEQMCHETRIWTFQAWCELPFCLRSSGIYVCRSVGLWIPGVYVANRASDKITQLTDNVYLCRSGSVFLAFLLFLLFPGFFRL